MAPSIRPIFTHDLPALAAFLDEHPDTTLFLRGNLADAGLENEAHPFGGVWVGAFDGHALVGVATHFNGGNVVVAGGDGTAESARLAVRTSGRPVRGVVGPWSVANHSLEALALDASPVTITREVLYRLELDSLVVPAPLERGTVHCRASRESEIEPLVDWRVAFEVESLGRSETPRQRFAARESVLRAHDHGRCYVLEDPSGRLVSTSSFNAWADGIVQIGGVFTPAAERGRGHGRSVVAGSLLDVRERGVHRAVLFTGEGNAAARRAYEALGFEVVGDYGLLLF